jgi:hypothetical protein
MSDYLKRRNEMKTFGKPPAVKKQYQIPKVSKKKAKEMQDAKDENGDTELVRWFRSRMRFMGSTCCECGMKVEHKIYQYAIMHIAHLLPKRSSMCPSVKYHPQNFITLCVDHHHKYDNVNWEEREKMACWPEIRNRLIAVWQELDKSERRHFPESVITYMKEHDNFAIEGEYDV